MSFEGQKGPTLGMRHMQALLLFLDMVAIYVSRLNIGVAVVAMTNAQTTNPDFPEYDWDEKKISYILSSYYWGYIVTLFPGGILCKRYGAKMVIGWATFISGTLCAVTPWCVGWGGWQAFCTIRILLGLSQGPVFTSIFEHLAKWSPLQERTRLGAFSHTGLDCGTVLAMGISGVIAEGVMGWPGISYVCAVMCFAWCMLWLLFSANNPCESRFITEAEKLYIESSMDHGDDFHKKNIPIPWKAIFTSVPTLTLVILRSAQKWGIATFESQIPLYMNGLLNMDIKSNALNSSLPFLASWFMSYVFLLSADVLQQRKVLTLTSIRKLFSSIASWIPAIGLIGIGFLDEDWKNLAVALMTISVALNTGNIIGSCLNIIDLSPNHAGLLYAIVNTSASLMALVTPLVVGVIVTDVSSRTQWQIVFAISATVLFFSNLLFIIFGTTETQPWDADDFLQRRDVDICSAEQQCSNDSETSKERNIETPAIK